MYNEKRASGYQTWLVMALSKYLRFNKKIKSGTCTNRRLLSHTNNRNKYLWEAAKKVFTFFCLFHKMKDMLLILIFY